MQKAKFIASDKNDFYKVVKAKVYQFLRTNEKQRFGGQKIISKAVLLSTIFLSAYLSIVTGVINNIFVYYGCWLILGFSMGGLGLNVMHDANHGSFSKYKTVNNLLGNIMNIIGVNPSIWKIQHNILHHSYPNVHNYDEDLNMPAILRMSPFSKKRRYHQYQQYYVWLIYLIGTLAKVLFRDFKVIKHLKDLGAFGNNNTSYKIKYAEMLLWKVIYFGYLIVIPALLSDVTILQVITGFVIMHFAMGSSLVIINYLAHFSDINGFVNIAENNLSINEDWAVHQLKTTVNFGNSSKFLTWFSGGLNFQIEHHLFPEISHVHYPEISGIVKETAMDFKLEYKTFPSFFSAIASHFRLMKNLGKQEDATVLIIGPQ